MKFNSFTHSLCVHMGFLHVLWFLSTSLKLPSRWIAYAKLPLGDN